MEPGHLPDKSVRKKEWGSVVVLDSHLWSLRVPCFPDSPHMFPWTVGLTRGIRERVAEVPPGVDVP